MSGPLGADDDQRLGQRLGQRHDHRLLLQIDAHGYGAADPVRRQEIQEAIPRLVRAAAGAAALRHTDWETQPQGDGMLVVLPDEVSEPSLTDNFMRALDGGLRNHNGNRLPAARLRLRATVHRGPAARGDLGYAGPGPAEVARLNSSSALRTALDQAPAANLVVGASTTVYDDVVQSGYTTLRADDFRRGEVRESGYAGVVWIWSPNRPFSVTADPGRGRRRVVAAAVLAGAVVCGATVFAALHDHAASTAPPASPVSTLAS